jgi:hypothetical protein
LAFVCAAVACAARAVEPADSDDGTTPIETTDHASTSSDPDPSTGIAECNTGVLPLCAVCPESLAFYCGLPCDNDGDGCSAPDGVGMECDQGRWECFVHPPIQEGCEDLCVLGEGCSKVDCEDSLLVHLSLKNESVAGQYHVDYEADAASGACEARVSEDPVECGDAVPCLLGSSCRELSLMRPETGPVLVLQAPVATQLALVVKLDGVAVLDQSGAPAYAVEAPNGPGCGPSCAVALVELSL